MARWAADRAGSAASGGAAWPAHPGWPMDGERRAKPFAEWRRKDEAFRAAAGHGDPGPAGSFADWILREWPGGQWHRYGPAAAFRGAGVRAGVRGEAASAAGRRPFRVNVAARPVKTGQPPAVREEWVPEASPELGVPELGAPGPGVLAQRLTG